MAGVKDFRKVAATGETAKLQERLQEVLAPVLTSAIIDGTLLKNVELTSAVTQVAHGLGREPLGWIIVNKTANQDVWQPSNDLPRRFLNLQASGTVTVSIWVF